MADPRVLTDADFAATVHDTSGWWLVLFTGSGAPAQAMAEQFAAAAAALAGTVQTALCNAETSPQTRARFSLQGVPTLILYRHGKPVFTLLGWHAAAEVAEKVRAATATG
jgi:thioredoxin-like negative regulator of GroEL